ncbi:MAG: NnrS family protein [Pikeienuella sp.]
MAQSSAEQMRAWTGPAILSYGFRPFFFLGALWAALAMTLWILMLTGRLDLPIAWDPVTWHAQAFMIGYLGAIASGFLLTAVPNWTGRLPVVGWRLGGLVLLWLLGRVAVLVSAWLPWVVVMLADLAFLAALAALTAREIVAGRNWRNLMVLALMVLLILGGALFHWEGAQGAAAAQGAGLRLMLATAVMMIGLIGGRIVPSFTRNWLVKRGAEARPAPPMQGYDKASLLAMLAGLGLWVALPEAAATALALFVVAAMQAARMARWKGGLTAPEPLLLVLHLAYAFVPLGALAMGWAILRPDDVSVATAQHLWMAGAIGLMTLAVMTRATLGHTGRELHAGAGTVALYLLLGAAVLARVAAGLWLDAAAVLQDMAGGFWALAFLGFAALYGPLLLRPKPG